MTVSPEPASPPVDRVFYDGDCGLCHHTVRFLLPRDRSGSLFRYAPLDGPTFEAWVPAARRAGLPDSIAVLTAAGELLTRSGATLHLLSRLGGGWGLLARVGRWIPRPLRDGGYDLVARVRHRLFARPEGTCPVVEPALRSRFDP